MRAGAPPRVDLAWADPSAKRGQRSAVRARARARARLRAARRARNRVARRARRAPRGRRGAAWVLKAPWTAAGRDRVLGAARRSTGELARAARACSRARRARVEPWLERDLRRRRVRRRRRRRPRSRRTRCSSTRAAGSAASSLGRPALDAGRARRARSRDRRARRRRARRAGYAGRSASTRSSIATPASAALHPLCEINARHTFGHVARALGIGSASRLGFGQPRRRCRRRCVAGAVTAWMRRDRELRDRLSRGIESPGAVQPPALAVIAPETDPSDRPSTRRSRRAGSGTAPARGRRASDAASLRLTPVGDARLDHRPGRRSLGHERRAINHALRSMSSKSGLLRRACSP